MGKPVEEIAADIYRDLLKTEASATPEGLAQKAFERAEAFVSVANQRTPAVVEPVVDVTHAGDGDKRRLKKVNV